jgi:hypothetical protein
VTAQWAGQHAAPAVGVPTVAAGMRRLRIERGMSLSEAGKLLFMNRGNVHKCESGVRHPPAAEYVAAAFSVTVAEVLAPCPHCVGRPPAGYECLRCRASSPLADAAGSLQGVPGGPS